MFKLLLSFVTGVAVTLMVCWLWVYPSVAKNKLEFGTAQGEMTAGSEIARKIRVTLGDDFDRAEAAEPFYGVKQTAVLVVTRNGVKTLRVYPVSPK